MQRRYQLSVKENDVLLMEMRGDTAVEEQSTVHAKGYAESITVLSSTTNRAPELIIEEEEMDEDGDEDDAIDDDLDICTLCGQQTIGYSFALEAAVLSSDHQNNPNPLMERQRMDPLYTTLNTIIHAYYLEPTERSYLKEGRTHTQGHIPVESTHKT